MLSPSRRSPLPHQSPEPDACRGQGGCVHCLRDRSRSAARNGEERFRSIPVVEQAALRRLAEVSAGRTLGTVEHACSQTVDAVEVLRRLNGRRVWRMRRMRRMRPKIARDGEVAP